MKIIIDVPKWIDEKAKEELVDCIKKICHLFSDELLNVTTEL